MALLPKISFTQNDSNNLLVEIYDTTGSYATNNEGGFGGSNIDYANAYARYRIKAYTNTTLTVSDTLKARKEYIKTVGTEKTYEGIKINVGDVYIPTADISILSGDTFTETGFYIPLIVSSRYQPNPTIPIYLNSQELGFSPNSEIGDNIFEIEYQVFGEIISNPSAVNRTTYLVQSNGTTYNGSTYKIGDVFTSSNTASIVGSVSPLNASYFNVFQTSYIAKNLLKDLVVSNILNPKPNQPKFQTIIANLYSRINSIVMINELENVSTENAYNNLIDIAFTCQNLKNNLY